MAITSDTSKPLWFSDVIAEFGGDAPHLFSEYYKGAGIVDADDFAPNVPFSGEMWLSDFYGAGQLIPPDVFSTQGSQIWTKPAGNYSYAIVEIWGGGAGGGTGDDNEAGGGGGGGGYVRFRVEADDLPASEVIVVGGGGAGRTSQRTKGYSGGQSSMFGIAALGGVGGGAVEPGGAGGGVNISSPTIPLYVQYTEVGGKGGNGSQTGNGGAGQSRTYAGGGGGGSGETSGSIGGAGGVSTYGGNGGKGCNGNNSGTDTPGIAPGGGGGGSDRPSSSNGAVGRIVVTYYFNDPNTVPTLTYLETRSGGGGDNITTTVNFGPEFAGRKVLAVVTLHNGVTSTFNLSSFTLGGVVPDVVAVVNSGERLPMVFLVADLPTGSSGVIHWTASGGADFWTVSTFQLSGTADNFPAFVGYDGAVPLTLSSNIPNSVMLAGAGIWGRFEDPVWGSDFTEVVTAKPQGNFSLAVATNTTGTKTASPGYPAGGYGMDNLILAVWQ